MLKFSRKSTGAISGDNKQSRSATVVGVLFFGVFFAFGAGFLYFITIRPVLKILAAEKWTETECTIISSEVESHSSSEGGPTYSVEVTYTYKVAGNEFQGDQYSFFSGSSSGYDGKKEVVDSLPPGKRVPCYYDPNNPNAAVIHRGYEWFLLFGLIPLVFLLVGVGGIYGMLRSGSKQQPKSGARNSHSFRSATDNDVRFQTSIGDGPLTLVPQVSPRGKLIGSIFVACFWNGIVSVFLFQVIQGYFAGTLDWFLALFLIPFVLIGLFLICLVFYFFLALFNPRPKLELSRGMIPLGEQIRVSWTFSGTVSRIKQLQLSVIGHEEARYRRGTNTYTDKSTFYEQILKTTERSPEIQAGNLTFRLPEDLLPSFEGGNNKIIWTLKIKGVIAKWPDVDEAFPLNVIPAKARPL